MLLFIMFKMTIRRVKVAIRPDKQHFERKIGVIFLSISLNICLGCSLRKFL